MSEEFDNLPPAPQENPLTEPTPPDAIPAPAGSFLVHPDPITRGKRAYDVLDLTSIYNLNHDPVPGWFRVTALDNGDLTEDVETDAPFNGTLSPVTEQLLNLTVDRLEALRKL